MAGNKYVKQVGGALAEEAAVQASAGAGDAGKIPALDAAGKLDDSILNAATTGNNKVVKTDGTGRLDPSVMPPGIGADTATIQASEALAVGDFVNLHDVAGAFRVRKADAATAGKECDGYVVSAVSAGANATVYFEGTNTQVSGMTPGSVYLSATTPGQGTATPPSGTGQVVQRVGAAVSATAVNFERGTPVTLA